MTIKQFILCMVILYGLTFFVIRGFISGQKVYQLNRSALRKREKGQSVWQWFWYTRFRDVIPRWVLITYYVILAFYPSVALVGIVLFLIFPNLISFATYIVKFLFALLGLIQLLLWIFFGDRKTGKYAYERWIPRKKGQQQKRHKKNH